MNKPELPKPIGDGYSAMFKSGETASLYKKTRLQVIGVEVVTLEQCEQYAKDYHAWKMGEPVMYGIRFGGGAWGGYAYRSERDTVQLAAHSNKPNVVVPLYAPKEVDMKQEDLVTSVIDACVTDASTIAKLRAEIEALKADAERYQWLRVNLTRLMSYTDPLCLGEDDDDKLTAWL